MQIKVTKKEAMEIYSQRYLDRRGKVKRYLPITLFIGALIIALLLMFYVNDWLGAITFGVLSIPVVYMTLRETKAAGKYARGQIKG